MYLRNAYLQKIKQALQKEKLVLLLGARQVGKTTLLHQLKEYHFPEAVYVNCEKKCLGEDLSNYEEFLTMFKFKFNVDLHKKHTIFLDEIQALPNFETFLKIIYDDEQIPSKFVVTGSVLNVSGKAGSTLVGRGKIIKVFPFNFYEFLEIKGLNLSQQIKPKFEWIKNHLIEYLTFGWYPKVVFAPTSREKIEEIENIIDSYLKKDILLFFAKEDVTWFKKILQKMVLDINTPFSFEGLATTLNISVYKVKKYIKFLENSFLVYQIYPFFTDKTKEYSQRPKIYMNDLGLINWFRKTFENIDINDGKLVENFVFLHLNNLDYPEISYYHKRTWSEIDFIVHLWNGKIIPLEAKSRPYCKTPRIFFSFAQDYETLIQKFVVTNLQQRQEGKIENISLQCLPLRDLMKIKPL